MVIIPETQKQLSVLNSFSSENYKIITSDSISRAFIEGLNHRLDLVIADCNLADGDPEELSNRFRLTGRKIPFLIIGEGKSQKTPGIEYTSALEGINSKVKNLMEQMPQISTQRNHPRYECNIDVYFESVQNHIMSISKSINLSGGGMFMATSHNLPVVGEFVAFKIPVGNGPFSEVEGIGVVRWRRERSDQGQPSGFAIEFVSLTSDAQKQVGELLSVIASSETLIPDDVTP